MKLTRPTLQFFLICLLVLVGRSPAFSQQQTDSESLAFFENKVRPLLVEHCYECHSGDSDKLQAGLRVDSRQFLLEGGDSGPSLIPGDPEFSSLMEAVRYESFEMPPKGKLPNDQIEILDQWVRGGAFWPEEDAPTSTSNREAFDIQQRKSEHWGWQPIKNPQLPEAQPVDWALEDLDRFVLAKLNKLGLAPSAPTDRMALMRRLYFDLIGLPPTPKQIADFQADTSPLAIARLVDQLLASPHFGERWGRHWLDLVRYAESRGHEFDDDAQNAFEYRDYIIRALNADVPYDQLVREHIAGDLLENPRLHPDRAFNESVLGTGFWFLGEWVHSPVDTLKDEADRFDNMIDVMSKTFLGVTVACARCHDHKFDAISTADYYSLTGFLQSSDYRQVRYESIENNRRVAADLKQSDESMQWLILALWREQSLEQPDTIAWPNEIAEKLVFDYQDVWVDGWFQDGFLFGSGPRHTGDAILTESEPPRIRFAEAGHAATDPAWKGLQTVSEKGIHSRGRLEKFPKSGRTLRSPSFEVSGETIAVRVEGQGHVVACVDSIVWSRDRCTAKPSQQ